MRLCAATDMTVNDVAFFDLDFVLPRSCLCVTNSMLCRVSAYYCFTLR